MQQKSYYNMGPVTGGLGISGSVTTTRPFRRWGMLPIALGMVALVIIVLWFALDTSRSAAPLAEELPTSAAWYGRIALPKSVAWRDQFFFWRHPALSESGLQEIIASLDVVHWDGASFAQDILPLFSGNLELAELENGETVLAARLSNRDAWYGLLGADSRDSGSIHTEDRALGGAWQAIAPQTSSWAWMIRGNELYVASNAAVFDALQTEHPDTVKRALKDAGSKGTGGAIYINSAATHLTRQPYVKTMLEGSRFPLVLDIVVSPANITFSSPKSSNTKLSSGSGSPFFGIYASTAADTALYAASAGSLYSQWRSALSDDARGTLTDTEALANALYGADSASLAETLADSELVFLSFSSDVGDQDGESDWMAVFSDASEDALQSIALSLFAIQHPLAVPVALADGSEMIELRADTEGITWDQVLVPYGGEELPFMSLQGSGEVRGYMIGTIPQLGTVLTSNLSLINRLLAEPTPPVADQEAGVCSQSADTQAGFRISGGLARRLFANVSPVQRILVSTNSNGGVQVCLLLQ